MNRTQQFVTGLVAALMMGSIVMMPARFHSSATYSASVVRQTGLIAMTSQAPAELPQDQVRDLSYN